MEFPEKPTTTSTPRPPLPEELKGWIGFMLKKALQELLEIFNQYLAPLGVEPRHLGVLWLLRARGPMRQVALGEAMRLDRTTIMRLVDDLELRGLVRRAPDPEDRRAHAVTITPEGLRLLQQARPLLEAAENHFLRRLSLEERVTLRTLLERLV